MASMKIEGDEALVRYFTSLGADMEKALESAIVATAYRVRTTAVKSIQTQTFGSYVKRQKQGGAKYDGAGVKVSPATYDHIASRPGDAPNTDTGKLVSSIAVEKKKGELFAFVGSGLEYANYLEFGTKNSDGGVKMAARPWLQPALDKHIPDLRQEIIKQALKMVNEGKKK